jgi:hypothetical protein
MTISARKTKVLLWTSMKITVTHMLTSFLVFTLSPLLLFHHHSSTGQGVMTFHNYYYSCNSRLPLFYIPECHVAFTIFSSDIIGLGILWVRTKNYERLIDSYNTLKNDARDTCMHCSCRWIIRPEENDWCRKMMHMWKIDRGFTAVEAYKFLTVFSCTFCELQ